MNMKTSRTVIQYIASNWTISPFMMSFLLVSIAVAATVFIGFMIWRKHRQNITGAHIANSPLRVRQCTSSLVGFILLGVIATLMSGMMAVNDYQRHDTSEHIVSANVSSIADYYGMRNVQEDHGSLTSCVSRYLHTGGDCRASVTYIDAHGGLRDGTVIVKNGKALLYAYNSTIDSKTYINASSADPIVLNQA
jgi:hypothetical protein